MKCYAECIADDLKDIAMVCLAGRLEDGVMARPQIFPPIGIFPGKFGTAFDIRKEEGNGTGGELVLVSHWKYGL
jgi:hypothetical protein